MSHPPPELSHWWGRRRGRTGGGGAILWGATDRDGMGGPGEGDTGESAEKQLPTQWSHQGITLSTPPPNPPLLQHFSFFLFLSFLTSSLTPLVYFLLWWTDLCMPLLDSIHQSYQCCGLNLFYLLNCMTWVQRDGAAKDDKMKPRSKQTTESLPAASFHEHNFQVWCDSEFFRSWLTKWITSHKTFARNVLPAKPFISHGATGLGCDPLVARLCTQPCSTDTPRCFSQHALGKSHYKAFFKWQHLSWRVWVWLDLSQNQYIHSIHLQDKQNERHFSNTELKPKTALFIFKRRFFFLSFFLLKYDLTSTEPTQFIGTEIITSV